jgi:hypothetical protein
MEAFVQIVALGIFFALVIHMILDAAEAVWADIKLGREVRKKVVQYYETNNFPWTKVYIDRQGNKYVSGEVFYSYETWAVSVDEAILKNFPDILRELDNHYYERHVGRHGSRSEIAQSGSNSILDTLGTMEVWDTYRTKGIHTMTTHPANSSFPHPVAERGSLNDT